MRKRTPTRSYPAWPDPPRYHHGGGADDPPLPWHGWARECWRPPSSAWAAARRSATTWRRASSKPTPRRPRALDLEQQAGLRDPEWPQFLHDAAHSGRSPAALALRGRRVWVHSVVGPVIASPVVAGGVVYIGGADGYLHALDAGSGREVWRFAVGAELVNTTPAVHGGLVYMGASGAAFFALDRRTGRPRWSAALRAEPTAPPVVAAALC